MALIALPDERTRKRRLSTSTTLSSRPDGAHATGLPPKERRGHETCKEMDTFLRKQIYSILDINYV